MASFFSFALAALLVFPQLLWAQATPDVSAEVARHLTARAETQAQAMNARLEVHFDAATQQRLDNAPCLPAIQLTNASRLWGRVAVQLRCPDQSWHAQVFANVRVMAYAPLLINPVSAGHFLQADDWTLAEIDLSAYPRGVLTDETSLIGARTRRPLRAGAPIPPDALTAGQTTKTGQTVRVVLIGSGFTIKAQGKAIGRATPGQPLQVELESGQRISGMMNAQQEVEIRM